MDRVFDVQLTSFASNTIRTFFSFESNGKRYLSVSVEGIPKLQSGQTISAALDRPNDWQSLRGILIHETGEIFAPSSSGHFLMIAMLGLFSIFIYMDISFTHPRSIIPVAIGHVLVTAFLLYDAAECIKVRRALEACVTLVGTPT